ncbi:MAG: glycerol kinase GlpK [Verrucomicrobia bacterium]|nr:glycerol kinase GlpK [Verrucomicrobiota bacterium]
MKYILALDQGTTSSRSVLISHDGQITDSAQKEFRQIFPQPGWVEHDANEIWSTQLATLQELLAKTKEIHAIGITNQRETTIVWDKKTGQPICNAIVWQDRRTTDLCKELKSFEPLFKQKTGLLLDPYFSGTKLHWILQQVPGAKERAKKGELAFGTVDTWLVWNLTKGAHHITDVTNASRTLLFNIHTLKWDEELLKILDIPAAILPQVKSSSEIYGTASILPGNIPISGIAGDQQAALFGQACLKPGMVKTTYGTGCFLLMNTGDKPVLSKNNLLTTIAYQIGPTLHYALEGSVFIAGAVVQWLRDSLGIIKASSDIEKLARSVQDNGGVYFVPAFTGLGAPHWDPYARGAILGLTRGVSSAHLARAALEGIAFQVCDVIKCMEDDAGVPTAEMRVDGGAVRDNLLMQIQADLLQVPVIRPKTTELTALGAGFLAGLATGFWKDMSEITKYWQEDERFLPQMLPENAKRKKGKWKQALKCAQLWESA